MQSLQAMESIKFESKILFTQQSSAHNSDNIAKRSDPIAGHFDAIAASDGINKVRKQNPFHTAKLCPQ
ncbi:MAG: hypothetical protein DWQ05_17465 [Calditrichaeota bacterium]|nr:MAG: hypothetical protein DWQ05_17465 [Calditrichota bacterium]